MSYQNIDPILEKWTTAKGLHLFTHYKDTEVRSIDVLDGAGKRCQLWIDKPTLDGEIEIHAWDYKKRRIDLSANFVNFQSNLESAYLQIKSWV